MCLATCIKKKKCNVTLTLLEYARKLSETVSIFHQSVVSLTDVVMLLLNALRALTLYALFYMSFKMSYGWEFFTSDPHNVTAIEGDEVTLTCETLQPINCTYLIREEIFVYWIVRWRGNRTAQDYVSDCETIYDNLDSEKYSAFVNGRFVTLQIKNVGLVDSTNEFFCVAYIKANKSKSVTDDAVLTVLNAAAATGDEVLDTFSGTHAMSHSQTVFHFTPTKIPFAIDDASQLDIVHLVLGGACIVVVIFILVTGVTCKLRKRRQRRPNQENGRFRNVDSRVDFVTWDRGSGDWSMHLPPQQKGVEELPYAELDFDEETSED